MNNSFLIAIGVFIVVDVIVAIVLLQKIKKQNDANATKAEHREPADFQIRE